MKKQVGEGGGGGSPDSAGGDDTKIRLVSDVEGHEKHRHLKACGDNGLRKQSKEE